MEKGDGDAALLYLALLRHHGTIQPRALAGELRWDKSRIEAAELALRELRLLAPAAEEVPEPADEKPSYQRDDIARRLESSEEFRLLTAEVEKKLGKRLTTPDVGVLLGLNDYLGLPADVIFLLVNHCVERVTRKYGEGRRPTLRQIEKEGYAWARRGIDTQRAAVEYLKSIRSVRGPSRRICGHWVCMQKTRMMVKSCMLSPSKLPATAICPHITGWWFPAHTSSL